MGGLALGDQCQHSWKRVRHNRNEKIRYVVEKCDPARLVSYVGHSYDSGFASHRTISFVDREEGGTRIEINYYSVGSPDSAEVGAKFVKWLTERWIYGFARFCEEHSASLDSFEPEHLRLHDPARR